MDYYMGLYISGQSTEGSNKKRQAIHLLAIGLLYLCGSKLGTPRTRWSIYVETENRPVGQSRYTPVTERALDLSLLPQPPLVPRPPLVRRPPVPRRPVPGEPLAALANLRISKQAGDHFFSMLG